MRWVRWGVLVASELASHGWVEWGELGREGLEGVFAGCTAG